MKFKSKTQALQAVKRLCDQTRAMAGGSFPHRNSGYAQPGDWTAEDEREWVERTRRALNAIVKKEFK